MPGVARVDPGEVPRAKDDLGVGLTSAGASLEQDKRFDIDWSIGEQGALFSQWKGSDPDAVLEVAEAAVLEIEPEFIPRATPVFGDVEQHQTPAAVPSSAPTSFRVASPERLKASGFGQPDQPGAGRSSLTFDPMLLLEAQ